MSIELLPRARVVGSWSTRQHSSTAAGPARDSFEGGYAVRVPVAGRRLLQAVRPPHRFMPVLFVWWFGFQALRRFGWWLLGGAVGLLVLLTAYRSLRLPRLLDRHEADVWLTPDYVVVGRTRIPWWELEGVVRLEYRTGTASDAFLALRVRDFVAVRGLSPFWAGLANLTRRRLVVLARVDELADPSGLARALERLVARPEERLLLSSETGAQLVRGA